MVDLPSGPGDHSVLGPLPPGSWADFCSDLLTSFKFDWYFETVNRTLEKHEHLYLAVYFSYLEARSDPLTALNEMYFKNIFSILRFWMDAFWKTSCLPNLNIFRNLNISLLSIITKISTINLSTINHISHLRHRKINLSKDVKFHNFWKIIWLLALNISETRFSNCLKCSNWKIFFYYLLLIFLKLFFKGIIFFAKGLTMSDCDREDLSYEMDIFSTRFALRWDLVLSFIGKKRKDL